MRPNSTYSEQSPRYGWSHFRSSNSNNKNYNNKNQKSQDATQNTALLIHAPEVRFELGVMVSSLACPRIEFWKKEVFFGQEVSRELELGCGCSVYG